MEYSEKIAWLSILVNVALVLIKASLALISGSLAIKADAIHSVSDVISSAVILAGIKISLRRTRDFPYGLYKVENLVALVTSLLIIYAGYEICVEVFRGTHSPPKELLLVSAGVCLTIVITWSFARFELKKGLEGGSPCLVADARHIWSDMLSSLIILASLLGAALGLSLDRYAAFIVVAFIGRTAFTIFLDSIRVLLDASLDHASLNRIGEIVLVNPQVEKINGIWARNAGRYKFVEMDLTLKVKELAKGQEITEAIERGIKQAISNVDRVLIHAQPQQQKESVYAIPLIDDQKTISEHFGEAPFFQLVTIRLANNQIIEEKVIPNPYRHEEKAKGIKVANWLLEHGLNVLLVRRPQTGKGSCLALEKGGAEIRITPAGKARRALEAELEKRQKKKIN